MNACIASGVVALLLAAMPAWPAAAAPTPAAAPARAAAPRPAALPGDSVLQLPGVFTDQSARRFSLRERRGQPQLVGMFYASCQSVCPLLLNSAAAMIRKLEPEERGRLRVLMVSLDPARDNAARLMQLALEHRLDLAQWTLASADGQLTRRLAAVLDIRYRQLAGGDFNHTAALTLLDADGRIVARTENIGATPDAEFLAALQRTLRTQ